MWSLTSNTLNYSILHFHNWLIVAYQTAKRFFASFYVRQVSVNKKCPIKCKHTSTKLEIYNMKSYFLHLISHFLPFIFTNIDCIISKKLDLSNKSNNSTWPFIFHFAFAHVHFSFPHLKTHRQLSCYVRFLSSYCASFCFRIPKKICCHV